jgi:hypothetical protein
LAVARGRGAVAPPDYDFAAAAEAILATGFPQAEVLVVRYVLNPPTEEESLRTLAGAELS